MEIPELEFDIVRKNKIMVSHLLKEYLGVRCVTNWYQSMPTTLGLLGLMHESHKKILLENFIG
jgi:hypothetical protein